MADAVSVVALFTALVAAVFAFRAQRKSDAVHALWTKAICTLESRSARTVTIDMQDGRVTVVKELKDVG